MMYSKTLIILSLILVTLLVYLVYNCKCENFKSNISKSKNNTIVKSKSDSVYQVKPIKLTKRYPVNMVNISTIEFPEMNGVTFYNFKNSDSKIDITRMDFNNLTFSVIIKPELQENIDKKVQENIKQIIATGNDWYLQLKSKICKFVYNGVSVESNININFNKFYLVSVVVANTHISIFINGNETKKEYNVPELTTDQIKIGMSKRNDNPFYGYMGNIDISGDARTKLEICDRNNYCSVEQETCDFKAAGRTRMDCIKLCDNNENCSSSDCQQICLDCKNPLNCEWLNLDDNLNYIGDDVPDAPVIRALPHKEGQIVVDWAAPKNNGSPIKNYAIVVKESFNNSQGITYRQLSDTNCSSCEYIINGLKNGIYYDISVAAVNNLGVSEFSNIESLAPKGKLRNSDISSLLIEDDAEIDSEARKIISKELNTQICNGVLSQERDGHFLNKKRVKFSDQIKEELVPKLFK